MANELTITASLKYAKGTGNAAVSLNIPLTATVDVTGNKPQNTIQTIGLASELVALGDLGTTGYVLAKNLDLTNFVTFSTDAAAHANPLVKLGPGEVAVFRAAGALYALADTAACDVHFVIIPA